MATRRRPRQCPRCGRLSPAKARECTHCFAPLTRTPFRMGASRIRYVHMLARQKGLITYRYGEVDDTLYRERLQAAGVASCKELKRESYYRFVGELRRLPDAVMRAA